MYCQMHVNPPHVQTPHPIGYGGRETYISAGGLPLGEAFQASSIVFANIKGTVDLVTLLHYAQFQV